MTLFQSFLLGLLQGFTEFLPISSSGHLVLLESILKLKVDELKSFDVALHAGSLVAIMTYFWKDLWGLLKNWKLGAYILVATIPAVIAGFTLENWLDEIFRDPKLVLSMLGILALFFLIAEYLHSDKKPIPFNLKNTFIMGLAQAVALIPGISRSGSVIGMGLMQGIKREEAAKFSFLLGIPAIGGAILLTAFKVYREQELLPGWDVVLVGFSVSAVVGYLTIAFLMRFLKTHSLRVFAIYLGIVVLSGSLIISLQN
ncbi:MAG: undecaprenol kinase, undecaprenyl-diphosphatase [Candidatus Peregrinibacteria bacterium GW2011_GWE2_39_6]|nr:MAG: undecaprenol kinase, undecaprenyl-diphosphatase [Candidatus Peregrinibacteria bacterium GW2011_GWF2_39_17]KKR25686.1 MAG: undecaprenol kinase, undecaprenyl-diphosphatase [Candidatus Peregrinibacteria bacterium GW2011_GWE2_39_6]HCW32612.1 hypothetical protein [Candidatus Peregrinibacteria bacterium]